MCFIIYLHYQPCNHWRIHTINPCPYNRHFEEFTPIEQRDVPAGPDAVIAETNIELAESCEQLRNIVIEIGRCGRCEMTRQRISRPW